MYNLIYVLKKHEFGSGLHALYLTQSYPELFNSYNYFTDSLPNNNKIWILHNPFFYKNNSLTAQKTDFVCVRHNYINCIVGKKIINGYSYYKYNYDKYYNWFPTIYQTYFEKNHNNDAIGYYIRDIRHQSNYAFINFIKTLPSNIKIITMGTKSLLQNELSQYKNWMHTYDNREFWKLTSHYYYYRCSDFIDPFPHTLLEAIQSNHRIISPISNKRNFVDGIDDLLSCIDFDIKFEPEKTGKPCKILTSDYWKKYMYQLISSNFEYQVPKCSGLLYDLAIKLYDKF